VQSGWVGGLIKWYGLVGAVHLRLTVQSQAQVTTCCTQYSHHHPPPPAHIRTHTPTHTHTPVGYVRYLLDTLAKRDLFSWLTLAPSRWWHCILYRDAYNFGGVEASLPAGLWEATERRGEGRGGGGVDGLDLEAIDEVDPTQIGTPGGPKLR